ncbi:MAG: hypothetical protein ABSC30_03870 [Acidimicrobiales bacterium]|jgi:hypothetical protein
MSVYSQLLDTALDQTHSVPGSTTGDVLAQLLERRNRLGAKLSSYTGSDWAPDAIADQLAYDVALIEFSRRLGIDVDLTKFGQPQHERARLEQALVSRGIHLDVLEESAEFSDRPQHAWGQR